MPDNADLSELESRMAQAVAAEDFEAAARLRDQIALIRPGVSKPPAASYLRRQEPGKMGLGTDQSSYVPPKGWIAPRKPDPMTRGHSKGGRRTKG